MATDLPLLSFVFTDIEGSSELWEKHGAGFQQALEVHDRLVTGCCERHGGRVVKNEGDAFFCVFDNPIASVQFALAAQQALQECDWSGFIPVPLRVRMGLHAGVAQARGGDYFGTDVNRTARICAAGHGGQVLASSSLLEGCPSLPDGAVVSDLARHRLRGLSEPQHLYQLTLASWPQQEWPVLRTLDHVPHNLPARTTSFVGREHDAQRLREALCDAEARLVTLIGPGGSGKSRLAQEAASQVLEHYQDGVFWVDLTPLTAAEQVPGAVLQVLKLQPEQGQPPARQLADYLRDRQVLLVLDNMEHVIEAADFLADLLRESPEAKLLVTSREVLRLPGEQVHDVTPLTLPEPPINWETLSQFDSVSLFIQRARLVAPNFAISESNAGAVAEICQRVDGIPLGIELAAAWLRVYRPEQILQQLSTSSQGLTSRVRGVTERQRTLRNTVEWSYRLLDEQTRRALRWLSVCRGGFFLEAAEGICGPEGTQAVLDLVDRSLLTEREVLGQPRFYMLETIREFAEQKLDEAAEAQAALTALAAHFRLRAMSLDENIWKPGGGTAQAECHTEALNLQRALELAVSAEDTEAIGHYLQLLVIVVAGADAAAAERLQPALQQCLQLAQRRRGEAWTAQVAYAVLANLHYARQVEAALQRTDEMIALAVASGDTSWTINCILCATSTACVLCEPERVRCLIAEAQRLAAEGGVSPPIASWHYAYAGMYEDGIEHIGRQASAHRGTVRGVQLLRELADLLARCGRLKEAVDAITEAVPEASPERVGALTAVGVATTAVLVFGLAQQRERALQEVAKTEELGALLPPARGGQWQVDLVVRCSDAGLYEAGMECLGRHGQPWPPRDLSRSCTRDGLRAAARCCARTGQPAEAVGYAARLLADLEGAWTEEQARWSLPQVADVLWSLGEYPLAALVANVAVRLHADQPLCRKQAGDLLNELAGCMEPSELAKYAAEAAGTTALECLLRAKEALEAAQ